MEHSVLATGTKELNFRLFFGMMIHGKEKACGDGTGITSVPEQGPWFQHLV